AAGVIRSRVGLETGNTRGSGGAVGLASILPAPLPVLGPMRSLSRGSWTGAGPRPAAQRTTLPGACMSGSFSGSSFHSLLGLLEDELPVERLAHQFLGFRPLFVRQNGLDLFVNLLAELRQLLVFACAVLGFDDLLQRLAGLRAQLLELALLR